MCVFVTNVRSSDARADSDGSGTIEFRELERLLRANAGPDVIQLAMHGPEKTGMRNLTRPQSAILGVRASSSMSVRAGGGRSSTRPATALPALKRSGSAPHDALGAEQRQRGTQGLRDMRMRS